jgi:hypothetical protein
MLRGMRTGWNVVLQCLAVLLFVGLRLAAPGWLFVFFVLTVLGPVLALLPLGLAIGTARRGLLVRSVAVPFCVGAGLLVVIGALLPDSGEQHDFVPLAALLGRDDLSRSVMDAAWTGGWVLVLAYLAVLTWLVVVVARTRDRTRQNSRRSFDSVPRKAS